MLRTRARAFPLALFLPLLSVCASSQTTGAQWTQGRRVLFVGNSLTYANDLPGIVQALADSARGDSLVVETVAFPDFALVDHWNEGTALDRIRRGHWDVVVLQQGPSAAAINRDSLRLFVQRFGGEIARVGARPALYSVWPTVSRQQDFDRAVESYALAASDVGGLFIPVASSWLTAWRHDRDTPLYSADGLHPSVTGSYLGALVMYASIFGNTPVGLPGRLRLRSGAVIEIEDRWVSTLQQSALEATQ